MCCSHHLTSFVVGEPFEVNTGRYEKSIAVLVTLNVLFVVFIVLGIILDFKKLLMFDKEGSASDLPNADGAAALEASSAVLEMSN